MQNTGELFNFFHPPGTSPGPERGSTVFTIPYAPHDATADHVTFDGLAALVGVNVAYVYTASRLDSFPTCSTPDDGVTFCIDARDLASALADVRELVMLADLRAA